MGFKKMPIYGRGADDALQNDLCAMDMYVVPELRVYLLYLQKMSRYHDTINAGKLKTPREDARMNAAQIKQLCAVELQQPAEICLVQHARLISAGCSSARFH